MAQLLPGYASIANDNSFQLPKATVESLPVLAAVSIGGQSDSRDANANDICHANLGRQYLGESLTGVLAITNASTNDLLIESVKASCGCTTAAPVEKRVLTTAATKILLRIAFKKSGPFEVDVRVFSNAGDRIVKIQAQVETRLSLVNHRVEVEEKSNAADVTIVINDENLDTKTLRVLDEEGDVIKLFKGDLPRSYNASVSLKDSKSTEFPVMLRALNGEQEVATMNLTVRRKGRIRIVPETVYPQQDPSTLSFRFFVVGDTSGIPFSGAKCALELRSMNTPKESIIVKSVETKLEHLGKSVLVRVVVPVDAEIQNVIAGGASAILHVNEQEFSFTMAKR